MPKKEESKSNIGKIFLIIFLVIAVAVLTIIVYYRVFYYEECSDWTCFNKNLKNCQRAHFIGGNEMIFSYQIENRKAGMCSVEVTLLQGELNNQDSQKLEGKTMTCSLPLGVIMLPELNIQNCHGLLKEEMQELFIIKLHTYLVQNIGKINLEVIDPRDYVNTSSG